MIGGGAAGLAAAARLGAAGLSIVVMEARGRLGGRIFTLRKSPSDSPVELGAEFIHGEPPELWDIIRAAALPTAEVPDKRQAAEGGRLRSQSDAWAGMERILERLDPERRHDRSIREFLADCAGDPEEAESRQMAAENIEDFQAADLDRVGELGLARAERGEATASKGAARLPQGYEGIITHLHDALSSTTKIRLDSVVDEVRWRAGLVEISLRRPDGSALSPVAANAAVITLPLGVLKSGSVQFKPALDEKADAMRRLESGAVARLTLCFDGVWWPEDIGFLQIPGGEPDIFWSPRAGSRLLTGWTGGPSAERLLSGGKDSAVAAALATLARGFGRRPEELRRRLVSAHMHDWSADPFARGAYSYIGVDGAAANAVLAAPMEDTLFFAGEATETTGEHGSVHGAIATGYRAAAELLSVRRRREAAPLPQVPAAPPPGARGHPDPESPA